MPDYGAILVEASTLTALEERLARAEERRDYFGREAKRLLGALESAEARLHEVEEERVEIDGENEEFWRTRERDAIARAETAEQQLERVEGALRALRVFQEWVEESPETREIERPLS